MWPLLPPQSVWVSNSLHTNLPIPYSHTSKAISNMSVSIDNIPVSLVTLEHVAVTVRI